MLPVVNVMSGTIGRAARCLYLENAAVLVRAVADGGTNLLGLRPVALMAPSYGPGSFDRHRTALTAAGVDATILYGEDVDRDVDRPADLEHFWNLNTPTKTQALLDTLRMGDRLRGRIAGTPAFSEAAL